MEILPLIGWVQMKILGSDWLVPNGNTGPKVNKLYLGSITGYRMVQLDLKNWALIGWFQMDILSFDWLVPNGKNGALIDWFQMKILDCDWVVPNGNTGLGLAGSKWKLKY